MMFPRGGVLLGALSLGWAMTAACGATATTAATPPVNPVRLYVCSQDAAVVTIIDMERQEIVETVDLQARGYPPNAKPHHVAVEPDGSAWYVSLIGANRVVKFDRENRVVAEVEFEAPGMLALHPTEDWLYVGRSMSAVNPPPRIGKIRRSTMAIDEIDVLYPRPHALTIAPGGAYVLTASLAENAIIAVSVASDEVEVTGLRGPAEAYVQFAVSPDGETLVVGGQLSGELLVFDVRALPSVTLTTRVHVGGQPWHPVFTPDGRWLYVPDQATDAVTVIDAAAWTVAKTIRGDGIAQPHGSAVSPDGKTVYISNRNMRGTYGGDARPGTIVAIDTRTQAIVRVIEVPPGASGLGTADVRR